MAVPAWKSRALAKVCGDVCAFLESVLQSGSRVSRFERSEGLEATQFSQVISVMRVKCLEEEVVCLKGENDRLKASLRQQHRRHKRHLHQAFDDIKDKVRRVEEVTNRVATNETALEKLENKIQQITPRFIKTKSTARGKVPPPLSRPLDSPGRWRQRLLVVTQCKKLSDHCTIVCNECNYNYRGRAVRLSAHMAHLKNKHQGFTPNDVDSQNNYSTYIPRLIEEGEEEKERQRKQKEKTSRDQQKERRRARYARMCGARAQRTG